MLYFSVRWNCVHFNYSCILQKLPQRRLNVSDSRDTSHFGFCPRARETTLGRLRRHPQREHCIEPGKLWAEKLWSSRLFQQGRCWSYEFPVRRFLTLALRASGIFQKRGRRPVFPSWPTGPDLARAFPSRSTFSCGRGEQSFGHSIYAGSFKLHHVSEWKINLRVDNFHLILFYPL